MAQNLAAKYRPASLEDVVEQSTIINIIQNICAADTISNRNFLFIGPAGCGKTSTARAIGHALNGSLENIIEMDAASHSGVNDMREIIEQARSYPVGSKYKVFIIDECFHKDSLVATPSGSVKISELRPGDYVFGLDGDHIVRQVFENRVEPSNLVLVHANHQDILTTKDHLFMTEYGWVKACDLRKGDPLYAEDTSELCNLRKGVRELRLRSSESLQQGVWRDSEEAKAQGVSAELSTDWLRKAVSNLWEDILHSSKCQFRNLFNEVCGTVAEAARPLGEAASLFAEYQTLIYLSCVWDAENPAEVGSEEVLFDQMHGDLSTSASRGKAFASCSCLRDMWNFVQSQESDNSDLLSEVQVYFDRQESERPDKRRSFGTDESEKSDVRSSDNSEDAGNEREEWYFACASSYTWWKRYIHSSADASVSKFDFGVDTRISYKDTRIPDQPDALSYKLQSRPRTSGHSIGSRSGWCRPQYEVSQVARSEKRGVFSRSRVEGIEIYKRGDNEQSFRRYFSDTELHSQYVTMYDLEIDGHPSYFVNDVLVHNCHAFSSAAWQSALKTLEEQPARSIFILCTTNPEKIPATIISRVQTFQLTKISLAGIVSRLKYIIEQENKEGRNITYTEDAIQYIGKMAQGGLRDSITLLEKALSYSENITSEMLQQALGLPNYDDYFLLLNAYAKKQNEVIVKVINDVYNSGVNFIKWFEGFFSFVTNIVKYIYMKDINATMIPSTYQDKIQGYTTTHAALCLKLSNMLTKMIQDLKGTQYLQEVAISYLCSPEVKKG